MAGRIGLADEFAGYPIYRNSQDYVRFQQPWRYWMVKDAVYQRVMMLTPYQVRLGVLFNSGIFTIQLGQNIQVLSSQDRTSFGNWNI
jgi:hypothetical protein